RQRIAEVNPITWRNRIRESAKPSRLRLRKPLKQIRQPSGFHSVARENSFGLRMTKDHIRKIRRKRQHFGFWLGQPRKRQYRNENTQHIAPLKIAPHPHGRHIPNPQHATKRHRPKSLIPSLQRKMREPRPPPKSRTSLQINRTLLSLQPL